MAGNEDRLAEYAHGILEEIGEDPTREGLERTPDRAATAWRFLTTGYSQTLGDVLNEAVFEEAFDEKLFARSGRNLVLTDVVMSEMSGPMMAKEMETRKIEIPIVFMSGYTDDRLAAHGFDPEDVSLVRKPFTPSFLVSKVSAALTAD